MKRVLVLCLLCCGLLGVMTQAVDTKSVEYDGFSPSMDLTAYVLHTGSATETYALTVPAEMVPTEISHVSVTGAWAPYREITVSADTSVILQNSIAPSETKEIEVEFEPIIQSGSNTETISVNRDIEVGNVSGILFGTWEGTFNYSVSMNPVRDSNPMTSADIAALGIPYYEVDQYSVGLGISPDATESGYTGTATVLNLPSSIDGCSVVEIGDYAFCDCSQITSVTIPDGVSSIGDIAFAGCTALESVILPNELTSTSEYLFSGCEKLTSIVIPSTVTELCAGTFLQCESLQSIVLPDSVVTLGDSVFSDCYDLKSVNLSDNITSMGESAFYACLSLEEVHIPNTLTVLEPRAFESCKALTSVVVPDSVTELKSHAFANCTNLTSITLPCNLVTLGNCVVYECKSLTEVTIPETVTTIGSYTFQNCTGIAALNIPSTVTSIGYASFKNVPHVYYTGPATGSPWGAKAIN